MGQKGIVAQEQRSKQHETEITKHKLINLEHSRNATNMPRRPNISKYNTNYLKHNHQAIEIESDPTSEN